MMLTVTAGSAGSTRLELNSLEADNSMRLDRIGASLACI
jgi:hypothetical protein